MKKTGYDQFFQKARENSGLNNPKSTGNLKQKKTSVQELRARVQASRQPKKSKSIPWKLVGGSFLGLVLALIGFFEFDRIDQFAHKIEISFLGSAVAETAPSAAEAKSKESVDKKDEKKPAEAAEAAKKKEYSEEELNHFAKLNDRKRELDAREEELTRLETELAAQKAELEKRMEKIESTRREISSALEDKVKADGQKVETLVQLYSNMKAPQAAKVFEEMDEDLAVEIFSKMKKKNAAEIMNIIKPEKAKLFTEKFAGYKRDKP